MGDADVSYDLGGYGRFYEKADTESETTLEPSVEAKNVLRRRR